MSMLDLVGVYEAVRRVSQLRIVGTKAVVFDEGGMVLHPDAVYEDLKPAELIVVPGGLGARRLMLDGRLIDYLARGARGKAVAGVGSGTLLLGKAGLLKGKRVAARGDVAEQVAPL